MDTNPSTESNNFDDLSYEYDLYLEDNLPSCPTHGLILLDGECYVCAENLLIAERFLEELEPHLPATVRFSPGDLGNKDRKNFLVKQKLVNCGHCPYHRRENETRRRRNPHDKRRAWKDS